MAFHSIVNSSLIIWYVNGKQTKISVEFSCETFEITNTGQTLFFFENLHLIKEFLAVQMMSQYSSSLLSQILLMMSAVVLG